MVETGAVSNKPPPKKSVPKTAAMKKPRSQGEPEFVDVREVAKMAGVARATIHSHLVKGTIPRPELRVGNAFAWRRSTIEQWVATRRRQGEHRRR